MAHPFIPFENTAKVELLFTLNGNTCENVWYFHNTAGSFSTVEMAVLASNIHGWYNSLYKTIQPAQVSATMIRVTDMTTQTSAGIEYTSGFPIVGTRGGSVSPANVTVAIKWLTGLRGRSYRGRTYVVGVAKDDVTGDTVTNTYLGSLNDVFQGFLDLDIADWEFVVASYFNDGAWRTTGVITPVTGVAINPVVDSQRRRLTGRGR